MGFKRNILWIGLMVFITVMFAFCFLKAGSQMKKGIYKHADVVGLSISQEDFAAHTENIETKRPYYFFSSMFVPPCIAVCVTNADSTKEYFYRTPIQGIHYYYSANFVMPKDKYVSQRFVSLANNNVSSRFCKWQI